uniref:Outer membrane protein beta-barrel domain-containing protein n=1 Tax=mine drainage metagenome TaxID=410659 RepID=E6QJQ3_9ZZZZ
MRSKRVFAVLFFLSTLPVFGQVAPTLKVTGIPLGVGGGLSDYSLDYGPGRRMEGFSAWADYSIFHGLGIEAEGTTILLNKPASLTRMRQDTIKGGLIYRSRPFWKIRPYVKGLIGIGSIDFPSNNPLYTHDTYLVEALGGGVEYPVWNTLYVRGDYEYQIWNQYQGPRALNPNGFTIGATYYFRKTHGHS